MHIKILIHAVFALNLIVFLCKVDILRCQESKGVSKRTTLGLCLVLGREINPSVLFS